MMTAWVIGNMNAIITNYYLYSQDNFSSTNLIIPILDPQRLIIANVDPVFFAAAALEGCAKLRDGRIINISGWTASTPDIKSALIEVANNQYRGNYSEIGLSKLGNYYASFVVLAGSNWGHGNRGNELEPFVSIAADQSIYTFGTQIKIDSLVGIPNPITNIISDGIVRVDDTGGAIKGVGRFDFFCGLKEYEIDLNNSSFSIIS